MYRRIGRETASKGIGHPGRNDGTISLKSANLPDGRRAKAAIRLENHQALGQLFLKALFAISRWSELKRFATAMRHFPQPSPARVGAPEV